jgi:hypothetical protein
MRLAISSAYWPIVWPSPEPVTLSIMMGLSSLELPVRPKRAEDRHLRKFEAAESAPSLNKTMLRKGDHRFESYRDLYTGRYTTELLTDDGMTHNNDTGWSFGSSCHRIYSIAPNDPTSAEVTLKWRKDYARDDWHVAIHANTHMSVTHDHYVISATLDVYEGDTRAFSDQWNYRIPRDHG